MTAHYAGFDPAHGLTDHARDGERRDPAPGPRFSFVRGQGRVGPALRGGEGIKITIGGSVRTTLTCTTARMIPDATPFFVLPELQGVGQGTTKIDARQSSLMLSVEGVRGKGFQLGAKRDAAADGENLRRVSESARRKSFDQRETRSTTRGRCDRHLSVLSLLRP